MGSALSTDVARTIVVSLVCVSHRACPGRDVVCARRHVFQTAAWAVISGGA